MKKMLLRVLCLLLSYCPSYGQFQLHPDSSFYDFLDSFYYYNQDDGGEGGNYNQVRRDEMYWGPNLAPDGKVSRATLAMSKYAQSYIPPPSNSTFSALNTTSAMTVWRDLGPKKTPSNSGGGNGIGQIHRIAFHPDYGNPVPPTNQIVYAGSHYGGLFKSIDGGLNWTNWYTDRGLPITSVSGIAVSKNNLYVCTGNGDHGYDRYGVTALYSSLGPGQINNANPIHTQGVYKFNPTLLTWESVMVVLLLLL